MGNIILFLITIIIMELSLYFIYRATKKSNSLAEKISYIILAIVDSTILILYYLDRFNVPTKMGWNVNINSQNWLNFIATYITGIISAAIAALVSVFITIYQIKKNNEDNDKRDKENLRIQNMPILKYEITATSTERNNEIDIEHLIISNCKDNDRSIYEMFILIKNIGLNSIKRIIINLESTMLEGTYKIIDHNNIIPIEKNEIKKIYRYFELERDKEYQMRLKVYYEDILQNWYYQTIDIGYSATRYNKNSTPIGQVYYKVNEEKLIGIGDIPMN